MRKICKNLHLAKKIYTAAARGAPDKYEVCVQVSTCREIHINWSEIEHRAKYKIQNGKNNHAYICSSSAVSSGGRGAIRANPSHTRGIIAKSRPSVTIINH